MSTKVSTRWPVLHLCSQQKKGQEEATCMRGITPPCCGSGSRSCESPVTAVSAAQGQKRQSPCGRSPHIPGTPPHLPSSPARERRAQGGVNGPLSILHRISEGRLGGRGRLSPFEGPSLLPDPHSGSRGVFQGPLPHGRGLPAGSRAAVRAASPPPPTGQS